MSDKNLYNNILIAIDFSDATNQVIERALSLVKDSDTRLAIIHVIDYFPLVGLDNNISEAFNWDIPEHELQSAAELSLDSYIKEYALGDIPRLISFGSIHHEIVAQAKKDENDLIILGSHGRHGVGLLLGSTANGVLHHAECDVLAVRITE